VLLALLDLHCVKVFIRHDTKIAIICTAAINDNKIHVLLSKCRICESFGTKKTLQDCSCKVNFSIMVLLLGIAQNQKSLITSCQR